MGCPEEVEDAVEVGEGVGDAVGCVDGPIAGTFFELVNVGGTDGRAEDLDDGEGNGDREP